MNGRIYSLAHALGTLPQYRSLRFARNTYGTFRQSPKAR